MTDSYLKILIVLLPILLSIIGFFAAYFFKRLMSSTDELNKSVSRLDSSISGMNAVILANDDKFQTRKMDVDNRLNKHSEILDLHEKDIAVLKEKVK